MQQAIGSPNGMDLAGSPRASGSGPFHGQPQATPIYAGSLAEACAQLTTPALGNVILRALVEQVGRTEAVEALQELLRRVER